MPYKNKADEKAYNKARIAAQTPEQRAQRLAKSRHWWFTANYGITPVEYDQMVDIQGGVCASCGRPPLGKGVAAVLNVDHDHDTGAVRGLLCNPCNQSLGLMKDSPEMVEKLLNYARYAESLRTEINMKIEIEGN
jgi:hypothetical protein